MTNTRDSILTLIKNRTKKRVEYTTNSAVLFTIKIRGVWYKSSSKMIRNNKRKDEKPRSFLCLSDIQWTPLGAHFPLSFEILASLITQSSIGIFRKNPLYSLKKTRQPHEILHEGMYTYYPTILSALLHRWIQNINHKPNIPRIQNWKHLYVKLVGKCIDSLKRLIVTLSRRKGWCYDYEWWWLCMWDKRWKRFTFYVIQILIIRLLVNNIINILNPYLYY